MWVFLNKFFNSEGLLAPRPTPKLEDHPSSAVRDCLSNLFAATLLIGGRSSIRNLRTRHAIVTGAHYSYLIFISSAAKTKLFVSVTARKFYQNTCLLSSQSLLSTCSHESPQEYFFRTQLGLASRPLRWSSINCFPIDYAERFRGCFCLQWVRAAIPSQPLARNRPIPSAWQTLS